MKNTNKIKSSVDPLAEARKNPRFLEYSKEAAGRMRLGAEVYNTRISRGLSQQELAALTGTTQKMISNIENAGVDVRYQTLNKIKDALHFQEDNWSRIFGFSKVVEYCFFGSEVAGRAEKNEQESELFDVSNKILIK